MSPFFQSILANITQSNFFQMLQQYVSPQLFQFILSLLKYQVDSYGIEIYEQKTVELR
mgnify:CR=1 FL=1